MKFKAPSSQLIKSVRQSDIKAVVAECIDSGNAYGSLFVGDDFSVVFSCGDSEVRLLGPLLLESNEQSDHLYIRVEIGTVYILATEGGVFLDEFEITLSDSDCVDAQLFSSFIGLYFTRLDKFTFSTNADISETDSGVSFNGLIEIPLNIDNVLPASDVLTSTPEKSLELKRALSKRVVSKSKAGVALGVVVALGLVGFNLSVDPDPKPIPQVTQSDVVNKPNEYRGLEEFYTETSIEPLGVLRALYRDVSRANSLRGWKVVEAKVAKNNVGGLDEVIKITSELGNMTDLSGIAGSGGYRLNVVGKDAYLAKRLSVEPLFGNYAKFHIGSYHTWLSTGVDEWWTDVDYSISEKSSSKRWAVSQAEITFPKIHPLDLPNLGGLVYGLPYSFNYLELKLTNPLDDSWEAVVQFEIAGVETNGKE